MADKPKMEDPAVTYKRNREAEVKRDQRVDSQRANHVAERPTRKKD